MSACARASVSAPKKGEAFAFMFPVSAKARTDETSFGFAARGKFPADKTVPSLCHLKSNMFSNTKSAPLPEKYKVSMYISPPVSSPGGSGCSADGVKRSSRRVGETEVSSAFTLN